MSLRMPRKRNPLPAGNPEKYCMRCGGKLVTMERDGRMRRCCESCGWIYFKNPASASAVVILKRGRVVLVKRRVPPYAGKWCLPAGFEEYDESPEETAVREAKEETNLDIRIICLCDLFFNTTYPGANAVVHIYLAELVGGRMKAGDDASEVRMFPINRLPRSIAFRSHLTVLKKIKHSFMF